MLRSLYVPIGYKTNASIGADNQTLDSFTSALTCMLIEWHKWTPLMSIFIEALLAEPMLSVITTTLLVKTAWIGQVCL